MANSREEELLSIWSLLLPEHIKGMSIGDAQGAVAEMAIESEEKEYGNDILWIGS